MMSRTRSGYEAGENHKRKHALGQRSVPGTGRMQRSYTEANNRWLRSLVEQS